MQADRALINARQRSGLTLRQLAERAGTSHATLSAYEHRRTQPSVDTANRVIHAAGFRAESTLIGAGPDDEERGVELIEALELAAAFPARHASRLRYPRFAYIALRRP